jgi:kynurenine formamidase
MIMNIHAHLGTEFDFQFHVIHDSRSLDDYAVKSLSEEGVVIDLGYKI